MVLQLKKNGLHWKGTTWICAKWTMKAEFLRVGNFRLSFFLLICHRMYVDFMRKASNEVPSRWDMSVTYIKLQVKHVSKLKKILFNIACYGEFCSVITSLKIWYETAASLIRNWGDSKFASGNQSFLICCLLKLRLTQSNKGLLFLFCNISVMNYNLWQLDVNAVEMR